MCKNASFLPYSRFSYKTLYQRLIVLKRKILITAIPMCKISQLHSFPLWFQDWQKFCKVCCVHNLQIALSIFLSTGQKGEILTELRNSLDRQKVQIDRWQSIIIMFDWRTLWSRGLCYLLSLLPHLNTYLPRKRWSTIVTSVSAHGERICSFLSLSK